MVKRVEEYPYSTAHYFLEKKLPQCLKNSYIAQNYKEAIEIFLNSAIDSSVLQQLKRGASLVEAPNIDKRGRFKSYF